MAISFFNDLFELKKSTHQYLASLFPFSIGDVFYILLGFALIYLIFHLFKKEKRGKAGMNLLKILNIFYFIYQIFWGMLYFQEPLLYKLSKEDISINEAKNLSIKFLKICKEDRTKVKENKAGVFIIINVKTIERSILGDQKTLPKNLIDKKSTSMNAIKPSIFKNVMSYTGILGYYDLFTAEAQYNEDLPASYLPFTLAHESSHQLGYAREQEANFVGFLIGENSSDPDLKYSTDLFALKSLLRYIESEDPKFVQNTILNYSMGMKRDLLAEDQFRQKHEGILDDLFAFTNNLFLRSNQQEGTITYSYFTELLIKYEREHF